jgi:N-acetylglucosaminyldiphosphoundecaprenol N-acetyl-beta-D-mannosaminyltransferase
VHFHENTRVFPQERLTVQIPANEADQIDIAGVRVDAVNMGQALHRIEKLIQARDRAYVCLAAVHSVLACHEDKGLRQVFNASAMTLPDGMPLVWLGRKRGFPGVGRVYGPDLMLELCAYGVSRGYGHFFFGGQSDVPSKLAEALSSKLRGLKVSGTFSPPFREVSEVEDRAIIQMINESGADILWIGLGTGKQEKWMAEHHGSVSVPVMIGVGAAFDFLSGRKPQAPAWMRPIGLEWLFRLLTEPRRLWRRYAQYPLFLVLLTRDFLNRRRA